MSHQYCDKDRMDAIRKFDNKNLIHYAKEVHISMDSRELIHVLIERLEEKNDKHSNKDGV